MNILAEKINLIQWLASIDDVKIIRQLKMLRNTIQQKEGFTLTNEEKTAIDKGLQSIKDGRVKSHEEVIKSTKEKFPNLFK